MLVYLALVVTAAYTPSCRAACLIAITAYCIYLDTDVLANVPFFAGTLLADLSLVVSNNNTHSLGSLGGFRLGLIRSYLRHHWAIFVFIVGLFFGSFPPDGAEIAVWSRFLITIGQPFLHGCIFPSFQILF
jgi:hypothetical protein